MGSRAHFRDYSQPAYKGEAEGWRHDRRKLAGKKVNRLKPESERIALPANAVPALVSIETWNRANDLTAVNRERATRNNRRPEAALLRGGFVQCGMCGRAMHMRTLNQMRIVYECRDRFNGPGRCSHTISAHRLDTAAWGLLVDRLTNPREIAAEIARIRDEDPTLDSTDRLDTEIQRTTKELGNFADALKRATQPAAIDAITAAMDRVAHEQATHQAERERVVQRRAERAEARQRIEDIANARAWKREELESLSYDRKRVLLHRVALHATVWPDGHGPVGGDVTEPLRWEVTCNPGPALLIIASASTESEPQHLQEPIVSRPQ